MPQQSRTIVHNAWKAFASHDADRIAAVFTEDAEWLAPSENATALALGAPSHMIGKKAIVRFLAEDFPRLFARDVTLTFHGIYADDDRVIVEETMTATLANGSHYANDYCFVFELQDGLIHRVREYMDTARGHRMVFGEAPRPALAHGAPSPVIPPASPSTIHPAQPPGAAIREHAAPAGGTDRSSL